MCDCVSRYVRNKLITTNKIHNLSNKESIDVIDIPIYLGKILYNTASCTKHNICVCARQRENSAELQCSYNNILIFTKLFPNHKNHCCRIKIIIINSRETIIMTGALSL